MSEGDNEATKMILEFYDKYIRLQDKMQINTISIRRLQAVNALIDRYL